MSLESALVSLEESYPAEQVVQDSAPQRVTFRRRRRLLDLCALIVVALATLGTFGLMGWMLVHIVSHGLHHVDWQFLTENYIRAGNATGLWPMIVATVYMVLLAIAIAAPVGIMTALYLTEFAKPNGRIVKVIHFATQSLAGIPAIIYGLFGLAFFVSTLEFGFSILAGAATLSILILPLMIRMSEESLRAVPASMREESYALGASRIYTIRKLILPQAMGGILTSIILGVGRVISESAPVFLTAGMVARIPDSVFDSGRTLAVHLYMLTQELLSDKELEQAYGTAMVLIIVVLVINGLIRLVTARIGK